MLACESWVLFGGSSGMKRKTGDQGRSRRTFLKQLAWAPVLFLPSPLQGRVIRNDLDDVSGARIPHFPSSDIHFVPHYPDKSPLDEILRFADPGTDEYVVEGYAAQISTLLSEWGRELKLGSPANS